MEQKLFKEQNVSMYKLQKDLKLGHSTLRRYANGERQIEKMKFDMLQKIAEYFNIDPIILYNKIKKHLNKK